MYSLIFWAGKGLKWLKGSFVILPQRSILRQTIFNLYVTDLQITSIHPLLVPKMQFIHLSTVQSRKYSKKVSDLTSLLKENL